MCDDVRNCCRICLDRVSDHVSIIGDPTISLHLKSCLSVSVSPNDHLPKSICVSCVSSLNQFYNFQINARCSQDWLESSLQEKGKKSADNKMLIQPLPDSEYNSDSLLEFLNNTANIEEYLNNLGKEDVPCIVNMLDKNDHNEMAKTNLKTKIITSPNKDIKKMKLETENSVTDVTELLKKDCDSKLKLWKIKTDKNIFVCFGCKIEYESVSKLLQHMSLCDTVLRTCVHCDLLFDSKQQMQKHSITHNTSLLFTCNCGEQFQTKERLEQHHKTCHTDYAAAIGCVYRCKECGDIFKERFQLYRHAKDHIVKAVEKVCDICGHTFNGEEALSKHRKEEHDKVGNVQYRCRICNFTSTDHKQTYMHVKSHNSRPEPTRHLCESCGHSFASRITLNRHMQQHGSSETSRQKELNLEHTYKTICEKCGQSIDNYELNLHTCV